MSLGSIAHLQYYFARTGLLDGKGAQLAKESSKRKSTSDVRVSISDPSDAGQIGAYYANSPVEEEGEEHDWEDGMMLPPTVSTYSHRTQYIPPPPDSETLRRELKESLSHVTKALADIKAQQEEKKAEGAERLQAGLSTPLEESDEAGAAGQRSPARGWHEIQGMHILDVVTLAIRSAREYYTMHESPQRLSKVKSERQIREELLGTMDVLKRMATRNFAGGMKDEEIKIIGDWVQGVDSFLVKEKEVEEQEIQDRQNWCWLEGDWVEGDRRREWEFMRTFIEDEEFPEWQPPSEPHSQSAEQPAEAQPGPYAPATSVQGSTPFLASLATGLTLVKLHNRILKKSKRQFGEITSFHADTAKPYRAADNLRYWIKAAEIRWEIKLQVEVMDVVYNKGKNTWTGFDDAILMWCKAVREEITKEWKQGSVQVSSPIITTIMV